LKNNEKTLAGARKPRFFGNTAVREWTATDKAEFRLLNSDQQTKEDDSQMNATLFIPMVVILFLPSESNLAVSQPAKESKDINLEELPGFKRPFKVRAYVRAAAILQEMGKRKACEQLRKSAEGGDDGQVAILCRLLFSKKEKIHFREPGFGAPLYLGGTSEAEWPLLPIELVDDVPFRVVYSYNLLGTPESSTHYLSFCLQNCEWSHTQFGRISEKSIERGLQRLLGSGKWKRPLSEFERQYLRSQIK
jgi:hypothetical protein